MHGHKNLKSILLVSLEPFFRAGLLYQHIFYHWKKHSKINCRCLIRATYKEVQHNSMERPSSQPNTYFCVCMKCYATWLHCVLQATMRDGINDAGSAHKDIRTYPDGTGSELVDCSSVPRSSLGVRAQSTTLQFFDKAFWRHVSRIPWHWHIYSLTASQNGQFI
jgi:hypothetical protein